MQCSIKETTPVHAGPLRGKENVNARRAPQLGQPDETLGSGDAPASNLVVSRGNPAIGYSMRRTNRAGESVLTGPF